MIEIHVTCKDLLEAEKISNVLLSKKLVACANYFNVKSSYWWKGKICNDDEAMLILKSNTLKKDKIIAEIKKNHSYSLPVITIHNVKTTKDVERWIIESMK